MHTRTADRLARSALPLLLALLLAPASLRGQDGVGAGPRLEDLFRTSSLSDAQISPDGSRVLYTMRTADLAENETDTDIWLVAADGGEPIQMTRSAESDSRPRWSPDGTSFAFLSSREGEDGEGGRATLYRMSLAGGEAERLHAHPTAIGSFAWSPDGRWIAFTARDEDGEESEEREEKGRDIRIEDSSDEYTHLWLLDVAGDTARRLTSGREMTVGSFDWAPDSRRLVFSATPTSLIQDSWKSDLYVLDVTDDPATPRRLTTARGPEASPVWTPDGEWIVYQGNVADGFRLGYSRVYRIPAAGGEPEDVSPRQDLDPSTYVFTPDGSAAFFEATTGTTTGLFYMPLDTREAVRLTPEQGVYGDASYSRDRSRVAFVHETPQRPEEVYAGSLAPAPQPRALADARALTAHNAELAGLAVGRTEVLRWRGADGRPMDGIVVYPAGWQPADGPGALVVKIHGGPSGVYLQNFQASSYGSNAQLYAADGYAVFMPNPRGSSGYGDASQRSVIEDWGGLDFQDIMTGVDTLIARGVAHPDSLGVMGWSYGGYMTAWTVTQTDRFEAAVVGAGITEPISMWGTVDILDTFEGYFGGGSPFEEGLWEEYQESSPLAFVRQVETPTLVIHGENDPRVPPNQAMTFYRSLRALDVPTALVWLPRTPHGPREPGLQYETARLQKEWMDHWIRGEPLSDEELLPFVRTATEQR